MRRHQKHEIDQLIEKINMLLKKDFYEKEIACFRLNKRGQLCIIDREWGEDEPIVVDYRSDYYTIKTELDSIFNILLSRNIV